MVEYEAVARWVRAEQGRKQMEVLEDISEELHAKINMLEHLLAAAAGESVTSKEELVAVNHQAAEELLDLEDALEKSISKSNRLEMELKDQNTELRAVQHELSELRKIASDVEMAAALGLKPQVHEQHPDLVKQLDLALARSESECTALDEKVSTLEKELSELQRSGQSTANNNSFSLDLFDRVASLSATSSPQTSPRLGLTDTPSPDTSPLSRELASAEAEVQSLRSAMARRKRNKDIPVSPKSKEDEQKKLQKKIAKKQRMADERAHLDASQ